MNTDNPADATRQRLSDCVTAAINQGRAAYLGMLARTGYGGLARITIEAEQASRQALPADALPVVRAAWCSGFEAARRDGER